MSKTQTYPIKDVLLGVIPSTLLLIMMLILGNNSVSSFQSISFISYIISVLLIAAIAQSYKPNSKFQKLTQIGLFLSILINLAFTFLFPILGTSSLMFMIRIPFLFIFGFFGTLAIWESRATIEKANLKTEEPIKATSSIAQLFEKKWVSFLILGIIFILALAFRHHNLMLLDTYRDEDHHISSARMLLEQGFFEYSRGAIVTYFTYLSCLIGDARTYHEFVYWGRIPSIIFGSLVVIPLFFLGRKINNYVGLITATLWAISPWAIGVSRNIREHPYYLFISLVFILILLELIPIVIDYQKKNLKKIIAYSTALLLFLIYAFAIDWLSTLKLNGVVFAVLVFAYAISHLDSFVDIIKKNIKILIGGIGAMALFIIPASRSKFVNFKDAHDVRWADSFLNPLIDSPVHWWKEITLDSYLIYFFLIAGMALALVYKKRYFFVYLITALIIIGAYHFFFDRYYAPRYIVYVLPFYTLILGTSIYYLVRSVNLSYSAISFVGKLILIAGLGWVFNINNSIKAVNETEYLSSYAIATTGEYHNDKSVVIDFFNRKKLSKINKEPFITSIYEHVLDHEFGMRDITKYKYKDINRFKTLDSVIAVNNSGWIILDAHRNGIWKTGLPQKGAFNRNGVRIKTMLNEDLCQIYRWNKGGFNDKDETSIVTAEFDPKVIMDISKPYAISFWINSNLETPGRPIRIGNNHLDGIGIESSTMFGRGGFFFRYSDSGECAGLETGVVNDKKWHHIVWYQTGGSIGDEYGLFVDGKLKATCRVPIDKFGTVNFYMSNFDGRMQDMRIYDQSLSEDEVSAIFNKIDLVSAKPNKNPDYDLTPIERWVVEDEDF